ncbi:hypothetical protein V5799_017946 [Amblyomma americanum]|uniref:Uncharacterized protein n=1 Tax=Amblyomma americanum TaxID=6943 RepID=A0AAQ4F163_AMBAM
MPVLADNDYYEEETKDEFEKAKTRFGIHLFNPKTPVELQLPGGIQKFTDILMEATFRKDMKKYVTYLMFSLYTLNKVFCTPGVNIYS